MPVDFAAARREAEAAGLIGEGGGTYKYKEGANKFRLLSECLPHPSTYKGTKQFKWFCYVLDRRDGKVKIHFMPHTIYKQIEALQVEPDYAFVEVPMPYDLTVNAKGAGTKDVEYALMPARQNSPLTDDEQDELEKQKPIEEVQQAIRDKQAKKPEPPAPVTEGLTDEDIPF